MTVDSARARRTRRLRLAAPLLAAAGLAVLFLLDDEASSSSSIDPPASEWTTVSSSVLRALAEKGDDAGYREERADPSPRRRRDEKDAPPHTRPFVSFVVPTSLRRPTLNRTLSSLLSQTGDDDFEAVVGIDALQTAERTEEERFLKASTFLQSDEKGDRQQSQPPGGGGGGGKTGESGGGE